MTRIEQDSPTQLMQAAGQIIPAGPATAGRAVPPAGLLAPMSREAGVRPR
jgi:hypothetical protein